MQPLSLQVPLQASIPQTQLQAIFDAFQEPLEQAQQQIQQQQQALLQVLQCIPAQQQQQPQPQAVPFSIEPGRAFPNLPLNYESSIGLKIWEQRIKPLSTSWDVDSEGTVTFCEELSQRVTAMG